MRITYLSGNDVQGRSFAHELTRPVVIFTGRNGLGKTTRLKTVDLALRGPGKDDSRYGPKGSAHLRIEVSADVHPQGRLEVLRGLSPKHSLSVQPLVAAGTKSLTQAQGVLDGVVQLAPVTFDLGKFVNLSPDKQKSALLPFATFIPASEYLAVYPSVVPFQGEAGSDFLSRVRMAIGEEIKTLQARKLAAERAAVELANTARNDARPADTIRAEIAVVDADLAAMRRLVAATEAVIQAHHQATVAEQEVVLAQTVLASLGGGTALTGRTSAQVRAIEAEVATYLQQWAAYDRALEDVRRGQAEVERARAGVASAEANLASCGGGAAPQDVEQLEQQLRALEGAIQAAARLDEDVARARVGVNAVRAGQLLPLALLSTAIAGLQVRDVYGVSPAAPLVRDQAGRASRTQTTLAVLLELHGELVDNGFPSASQAQASVDMAMGMRRAIELPADPAAAVMGLREVLDSARRARAAAQVRTGLELALQTARRQCGETEARCSAIVVPPAPGTEQQRAQAMADAAGLSAERLQLEALERQASQQDSQRQAAEKRLTDAQAQLALATERIASTSAEKGLAAAALRPDMPQDVSTTQIAERLEALRRELDEASRAEGKVEAERQAYQDGEAAKASIVIAKAAEKAAKEAAEDCLKRSLGPVASVFAPFAALLDGLWRLGDERPLGLERNGTWIDFELLSESERLVYSIGLVLAFATAGKGLRLVLLDGLDSCDEERRHRIVEIASELVAGGRLDNVLGTAWSPVGFEHPSCQIIDVAA